MSKCYLLFAEGFEECEGLVTLDITPAVSRLVRTETSATGNTNAPVIDIRQASSIVRAL